MKCKKCNLLNEKIESIGILLLTSGFSIGFLIPFLFVIIESLINRSFIIYLVIVGVILSYIGWWLQQ